MQYELHYVDFQTANYGTILYNYCDIVFRFALGMKLYFYDIRVLKQIISYSSTNAIIKIKQFKLTPV